MDIAERIMSRLTVEDRGFDTPCWVSDRATCRGYPEMRVNRVLYYVHRLAYETWVGPIPEGLTIDHRCTVKQCCNPAHLEPLTTGDNTRRHHARTTHCPQGHEYTEANTYRAPSRPGSRICRACWTLR